MLPGCPYQSHQVIVKSRWNNYLKALCIVQHTQKKNAWSLTNSLLTSSGLTDHYECQEMQIKQPPATCLKKNVCHHIGISCSETNNFLIAVAFCTAERATPGMLNWINTYLNCFCKTCLKCLERVKQNGFTGWEKRKAPGMQLHIHGPLWSSLILIVSY